MQVSLFGSPLSTLKIVPDIVTNIQHHPYFSPDFSLFCCYFSFRKFLYFHIWKQAVAIKSPVASMKFARIIVSSQWVTEVFSTKIKHNNGVIITRSTTEAVLLAKS
jgi:hypothetical protein